MAMRIKPGSIEVVYGTPDPLLEDSEQADTTSEIDAAVAQIMASRYQPQVGDRVVVTGAIAECPATANSQSAYGRRGIQQAHAGWEMGATAIVEAVESDLYVTAARQGHRVIVRYQPKRAESPTGRSAFLAIELEPLTDG